MKRKNKEEFEPFDVQVLYGSLRIRKTPTVNENNIVGELPINSIETVFGAYRGFYRIKNGWIMQKYCKVLY